MTPPPGLRWTFCGIETPQWGLCWAFCDNVTSQWELHWTFCDTLTPLWGPSWDFRDTVTPPWRLSGAFCDTLTPPGVWRVILEKAQTAGNVACSDPRLSRQEEEVVKQGSGGICQACHGYYWWKVDKIWGSEPQINQTPLQAKMPSFLHKSSFVSAYFASQIGDASALWAKQDCAIPLINQGCQHSNQSGVSPQ